MAKSLQCKHGEGVGVDVCCEYVLLPLANKEAGFGQGLSRGKPG